MEDRDAGISYAEFSYMPLQGNDFLQLRTHFGCELQIGATDQWGNITVGTELTRKKLGASVWGLVFPLLAKPDGTKYGKTASGAVWLDPQRTSPYRFYQFFMQIEDAAVIRMLKILTFLPEDAIAELERQVQANAAGRAAQKALARELTQLVHGEAETAQAQRASEILFGGGLAGVTEAVFRDVVGEVPTRPGERGRLAGAGTTLTEALVQAGLCPSKGQARKDIEGGGIYLNNERVADVARSVTTDDLQFGRYILLRKGKRTYTVLDFAG